MTIQLPKYPELLLKNAKSEIYQSKNNIKYPLLNMGGYKNIYDAKRVLGINNANEVYELLLDDWNRFVDNENRNRINKYKKELKKYDEVQVKIFNEKAKKQVEIKNEKKEKRRIQNNKPERRLQNNKPEVGLLEINYTIRYELKPKKGNLKLSNIFGEGDVFYPNKPLPNRKYNDNLGPTQKRWTEEKLINLSSNMTLPNKLNKEDAIPYKNNRFVSIIGANILDKPNNPLFWEWLENPTYLKKTTDINLIHKYYIEKHIKKVVKQWSDPYYVVEIKNYKFNKMDKKILDLKKTKSKIMMKNAFILKNDWLAYSKGIMKEAYEETENKCVYYQLEKFLLNPPSGNPTQFINRQRTSQEALYNYFNQTNEEDNEDFCIQSGVSTEMISKLCKDIKRNMYAYDENNKCFYNVLCNDSKNYCPLVFYCMNGHFYLINDPKCIRSVAESNKPTAKKIKSSSIENEQEQKEYNDVFHIKSFDIENAKQMNKGIYILQQSNLEKEIIEFITFHGDMVKTKNRDNVVIQITFKNEADENVIICVDTNYGQNIDYEQIKNVANQNGMEYTNEGVGSVLMKILENKTKSERIQFTDEERNEIINLYDGKCALCNEKYNKYEIDHINSLASGGTNEIDNLQPLCIECHKQKTKEENEIGIYRVNDEVSSTFNDKVIKQIVNTSLFKSWQFVEKVNANPDELDVFKIDMNKCRRNITYYSNFKFPVYSIMDTPKPFNGIIKCGMFYIKTSNVFPFRGCGWYFEPLIKYGIDNKLIKMENIVYEFIPYKTLPNDYFKKNIDILLDAFSCEPSLQKVCINAFVGLMGITKRKICYSKYSLCPYTASAWYVNENKNVFIKNHHLTNGEVLYQGIFSEEVLNETTQYCIYSMILQLEALELHKLETIVLNCGGIVLDRNTDAIRYANKKEIDIVPYYYDEDNKVRKYKPETPSELHVEHLSRFQRSNVEYDFNSIWNIEYGYSGTATEKAQNIINSNKSIHIDGRAGCGKTYLVNEIIKQLEDKKHIGFSPTNKGARLINGSTIHSMYHKFKRCKKMLFNILEKVDYIFVDEVSMMIEKFYTLFIMIKRALPHIKFVISGDFGQLPPVNDSWNGDYENSEALWFLCDGNKLKLTEYKRGDKDLFLLCKNVETVNINNFKPKQHTYLNLAYTHHTRIKVNNECMERYLNETKQESIFIPKDIRNENTQNIKLCVGMPIIAHTTDKKINILNSQKFIVKQIKDNKIILNDDNDEVIIDINKFHKYFYLGFCITIHASQGETFTQPYTVYDWSFKHFCKKAKYVALSRATSINNIQIM